MQPQGVGANGSVSLSKDCAIQAGRRRRASRSGRGTSTPITTDERAFDLWGVPLSDDVSFDDLSAHIHPADRDRVRAAFSATRAIVGAYEIDFRIMVGEEVRWVSARGQGDDADVRDLHRRDGTQAGAMSC
jgi:hypothetical protein